MKRGAGRKAAGAFNGSADAFFMTEALSLAENGLGRTRPNPSVGAVVVKGGKIVGRGWHKRVGDAHAEVEALRDAGIRAKGATVYVSLEPCSRPGRVGACTDALAAAGVARVVYAVTDPNPRNAGRARAELAASGVACERLRAPRELLDKAERLIRGFSKVFAPGPKQGLPFVTVKIAMSLDGRICDGEGNAKWISSAAARAKTGALRNKVDAVMVGAETLRRDNPSLLCRQGDNPNLLRLVVTTSARGFDRNWQVFSDDARHRTFILCVGRSVVPRSLRDWERDGEGAIGGVIAAKSLEDGLRAFSDRTGALEILCEGGMKLAVSLAEAGLVDEWITVLAPKVVGTRRIDDATVVREVKCLQDW